MGFSLKSVTKSLGPLSAAARVFDPLNLSGLDQSGLLPSANLGDLLSGKKSTYNADALAGDINGLAGSGLREFIAPGANKLKDIYSQDPSQMVNNQIGLENKLLQSSTEDARRRTGELLAQRGMNNSSIGLGQEVGLNKQLGDQVAMNNASGIQRLRDANIQNAQGMMQTGSNLFGLKTAQGPIQMQSTSVRKGGLTGQGGLLDMAAPFAGAIGSIGGAMMAGPAGASAGGAVGGAMAKSGYGGSKAANPMDNYYMNGM